MASHTKELTVKDASGAVIFQQTWTTTEEGRVEYDIAVTGSPPADFSFPISITVAKLKSVVICSDQDVTLETNSAGTPVDTLALKAGVPYEWSDKSPAALKFTTDVTGFFFTGAVACTVKYRALMNQ